ncbi:MAG: hypothetical protein AABZ60_13405 [Planctomycetota bacterium]
MLPVEEILRLDREAEEKRKRNAIKRKKRETRIKWSFFGGVALFIFIVSPIGLQWFATFIQPYTLTRPVFRTIYQKSVDVLWVYGYLDEAFAYYKFTYDSFSETEHLALVQNAFYNMALTQYHLAQYRTSLYLYRIYKLRWPEEKERLELINKRIEIMLVINPNSLGSQPPPWVKELADKYNLQTR